MRSIAIDWLRRHVGVVSQEPTLFDTSVFENIAFGANAEDEAADEAAAEAAEAAAAAATRRERLERAVRKAAIAANAHEFILEAGGYQARVGERGSAFSGGQRQRIAIARALLRDPSVRLLEANLRCLRWPSMAFDGLRWPSTGLPLACRWPAVACRWPAVAFH